VRFILATFRYLWASPATALGLGFALLAWLSGGRVCLQGGIIEVHGGLVHAFLRRGFLLGPAAAMTLGHVVLGRDSQCLARSRAHELVHVRQFERWGPFLLPVYLGAGLVLYLRGLDPYLDNPFEREAFGS
jgi:hypothetical protein